MSILGRFRKLSSANPNSRTDDPHQWDFPSRFPSSGHESTLIPNPGIFKQLSVPQSFLPVSREGQLYVFVRGIRHHSSGPLAEHLCLLECFYRLKRDISNLALEGSADQPAYSETSFEEIPQDTSQPSPRNEKKWKVFVELAVSRFRVWFDNIDHVLRHASAYTNHSGKPENVRLSKNYLPPIDFLFVWYTYLLHPSTYKDDCWKLDKVFMQQLQFPWAAINEVIDRESMT